MLTCTPLPNAEDQMSQRLGNSLILGTNKPQHNQQWHGWINWGSSILPKQNSAFNVATKDWKHPSGSLLSPASARTRVYLLNLQISLGWIQRNAGGWGMPHSPPIVPTVQWVTWTSSRKWGCCELQCKQSVPGMTEQKINENSVAFNSQILLW